jgi:hypothetical protein
MNLRTKLHVEFYLDYASVIGKPGYPLSRPDAPFLDNVAIHLKK